MLFQLFLTALILQLVQINCQAIKHSDYRLALGVTAVPDINASYLNPVKRHEGVQNIAEGNEVTVPHPEVLACERLGLSPTPVGSMPRSLAHCCVLATAQYCPK